MAAQIINSVLKTGYTTKTYLSYINCQTCTSTKLRVYLKILQLSVRQSEKRDQNNLFYIYINTSVRFEIHRIEKKKKGGIAILK